MRHTSARLVATAAAMGTAAVLTACGSGGGSGSGDGLSDLSAQKISDRSEKAFRDAKSVHLNLDGEAVGAQAGTPGKVDLHLDRRGNCVGTISTGEQGTVELVKRGEKVWMKPDAAFWKTQVPGKQGEAAAELFKGRYIHGTTSDAMLQSMAQSCDLKQLQKELTKDDTSGDKLTKGKETDVDGTPTIPIGSKKDGATQTVYVAAEGEPYPLKITSKGGESDGTMAFTDYDKPVPSETPAASESVDVAKLQEQMAGGAGTA